MKILLDGLALTTTVDLNDIHKLVQAVFSIAERLRSFAQFLDFQDPDLNGRAYGDCVQVRKTLDSVATLWEVLLELVSLVELLALEALDSGRIVHHPLKLLGASDLCL